MKESTPALRAVATVEAQDNSARPNVLFIVGDDIGFGDLGISGSVTRTANLDRLAKRGTFFTNFHVSPVCSVTRSMLLTGNDPIEVGLAAFDYTVYPPSHGKPGYEAHLTRTTAKVAELLQDAGYRTYTVGKWHLGGSGHGGDGPHKWGFDGSYGLYTGAANHWNQGAFQFNMNDPKIKAILERVGIPQEPYYENGKSVMRPTGVFSDELWTSKLLGFLEDGRESGKPFSVADATRMTIEACRGLTAAHDTGVVHRDIKPANLMLTPMVPSRCQTLDSPNAPMPAL